MSRAFSDSLVELFIDLIKTGVSWLVGKGLELLSNIIPGLGTIGGFFVGLGIGYAVEWAIGLFFNKNRMKKMKDNFYKGFQNSEKSLKGTLSLISKSIA